MIGNKYNKFKEAVDLVSLKGCISIRNQGEFLRVLMKLKSDEEYRQSTGKINQKYIQENLNIINLMKINIKPFQTSKEYAIKIKSIYDNL